MKLTLLVASAFLAFGQSNPWYQTDFPPDEFNARWTRVLAAIGDNGVAVLQGVSQTPGFITPRQSNDFYYLCGIETPHSYLLIDGRTKKITLFLPPRNAQLENAEGKVLSASDTDVRAAARSLRRSPLVSFMLARDSFSKL